MYLLLAELQYCMMYRYYIIVYGPEMKVSSTKSNANSIVDLTVYAKDIQVTVNLLTTYGSY